MVTILLASPAAGVYVNANGWVVVDAGLTVPEPFSDMITPVALPPNVLSLTVTGVVPHVFPLTLLNVSVGGLVHPHAT